MKKSYRTAVIYAALSYIAWGLLPIYWKLLHAASPVEILTHRIVGSAVFLAILISIQKRWPLVRRAFADKKIFFRTVAGAFFISANWILYIWGVNSGRIVESSLGYFINPLMSIALGRVLLGERLRPMQLFAVALALCGVLHDIVSFGSVPYFALGLAGTFACYGLLRKQSNLGPTDGLLAETLIVAPAALCVLMYGQLYGTPVFLHSTWQFDALLLLAGVVTSVPLLWFARGARELPLTTMGILQYFSPTLQFIVGAVVYGEPVGTSKAITFAFIWAGLIVYTVDARRRSKQLCPLTIDGAVVGQLPGQAQQQSVRESQRLSAAE